MRLFGSPQQDRENLRALAQVFVGPLDEPLPWTERCQYFLSACFASFGSLVIGLAVLVGPEESGGDAAPGTVHDLRTAQGPVGILFSWLFASLFWVFKVLLVFGIPFGLIYYVLCVLPSFRSRLAGYAAVVALVIGVDIIMPRHPVGPRQPGTAVQTSSTATLPASQAEASPAPQAQPAATDDASRDFVTPQDRAALAARVDELSASVRGKWRADVEAAGAFGDDGEVPPMLRVVWQDESLDVTNSGARSVCVAVARVARDASGKVGARCGLGLTECQQIPAGGSRRFTPQRGNSPTCQHSLLEFRVGGVTNPEPSWWSRSALESFDPSSDGHEHARMPTPVLAAEKAELLSLREEEEDRAGRWRRELQSAQ